MNKDITFSVTDPDTNVTQVYKMVDTRKSYKWVKSHTYTKTNP